MLLAGRQCGLLSFLITFFGVPRAGELQLATLSSVFSGFSFAFLQQSFLGNSATADADVTAVGSPVEPFIILQPEKVKGFGLTDKHWKRNSCVRVREEWTVEKGIILSVGHIINHVKFNFPHAQGGSHASTSLTIGNEVSVGSSLTVSHKSFFQV